MRTWMESIENGSLIYCVYATLTLFPLIIASLTITREINIVRFTLKEIFAFYLCCMFALVFLPLPTPEVAATLHTHQFQIIPFRFVADIIRERTVMSVAQVVFNIVMTIPFGAYLRYAHKFELKTIFFLSLALTCFIEIGQLTGLFFLYEGSYRFCDVDDVMANTLGGILGCLAVMKVEAYLPDLNRFTYSLGKVAVFRHKSA